MPYFAVSKKCMTKDFSDFSFSPSGFLLFLFSCSCWLFSSSLTSICHHLHLHLSKLISPLPPLPGCSFSLSLAAILSSLTLVFLSWPILSLSLLSPCYLLSLAAILSSLTLVFPSLYSFSSLFLFFLSSLPGSYLTYPYLGLTLLASSCWQACLSSISLSLSAWQLSHTSLPRSLSPSLLLLASLPLLYFSFFLSLSGSYLLQLCHLSRVLSLLFFLLFLLLTLLLFSLWKQKRYMSHVSRKTCLQGFCLSDQVRHKPGCTTTEDG